MKQKRLLALMLALLTLFSLVPMIHADEEEKPGKYKYLTDFNEEDLDSTNVDSIFYAAEQALDDGAPAAEVKKEMYAVANEFDLSTNFNYAVANMAAYETDGYNKMLEYCGSENSSHSLDIWDTPSHAYFENGYGSVFGLVTSDEEVLAMLKDPKAQYCFDPCYWTPAGFKKVFGKDYSKFTPSAPRPGYVAVILKPGLKINGAKKFSEDLDDASRATEAILDLVSAIAGEIGAEDSPVFTGNPNLASTFWVFDLQYPLCGTYVLSGDSSYRVKGYNCKISVNVINAKTKKSITSLSATNKLGKTVYEWDDDTRRAEAGIPNLREKKGFSSFVSKVKAAVKKERNLAQADKKITRKNAKEMVDGVLTKRAGNAKDAWQKAILLSGAEDILIEEKAVSFTLSGYIPAPEQPYAEADNAVQWIREAFSSSTGHTLSVRIPTKNGKFTKEGLTAFDKTIAGAAAKAKKAFNTAEIRQALTDYLFPQALETAGTPEDANAFFNPSKALYDLIDHHDNVFTATAYAYTPLFYAQDAKARKISFEKGPHAIKITCVGADPESLSKNAFAAALKKQAQLPYDERLRSEGDAVLIPGELALGKYKTKEYTVTVDIDEIIAENLPASYISYIEAYTYEQAVEDYMDGLDDLAPEASLPLPKNGVIKNPKKGVTVTIKLPKGASPTYVQIRKYDSDTVVAAGFVHPGKKISFRIPKSKDYQIFWCSGTQWYGQEEKFGPNGVYNKTERYSKISGSRLASVTLTLQPVQNGDVPIYGSNPSEFV